jgi:RNA polymerase primary sigma factor
MKPTSNSASLETWRQERDSLPRGSADTQSYLNHLTRQRLLTFEEEVALSARVQNGDARAKDRLVEANMRLVINIAKNYHNPLVPFEDLIQEGAIGLMMAAERFDPSKGFRFSTFATLWIRKAISGALDNKAKAIRLPAHVAEALRKLERVSALLAREQGEEPTLEQIATRLGVAAEQVEALLQVGQEPVSLDMLVGQEENTTLASLLHDHSAVNPQEAVLRQERQKELNQLLSVLSPGELAIICKGLGFEKGAAQGLQKSGEKRHVSRERARRIEIQALRKLKTAASLKPGYDREKLGK